MGNGTTYEEGEKLLDAYYEMGGNVSELTVGRDIAVAEFISSSTLPTTTKVRHAFLL